MIDIFKKLGDYFNPKQEEVKQEEEIKVVGFYTRNGDLFLYNSFDDRFDNFIKVDLSDSAFKYKNNTIEEAEICMQIEGNVGDLMELTLFV